MLEDAGYTVHHNYPSVETDYKALNEYDLVLVGVSPILSLSSNRAYGALKVINELKTSEKMMYIVDSPEPEKIQISLRSVLKSPETLFKNFYKSRSEFSRVSEDKNTRNNLLSAVEHLSLSWGKKTIYPSSPFINDEDVDRAVFRDETRYFRGVSIDSRLMSTNVFDLLFPRARKKSWVATDIRSKWVSNLKKTLRHDVRALKKSKADNDVDVELSISDSLGLIAGPQANRMLWWSYPIVQAMNTGTVVATDWQIGAKAGGSWTYLPSYFEDCQSVHELIDIARSQRETYLGNIDSVKEAVDRLVNEIENPI
jgi:hypothetical protein